MQVSFKEGEDVGTYYVPEYAGPAESDNPGEWVAGDELIYDANGNPFRPVDAEEMENARKIISDKTAMPDFFGGFNNQFKYGQFQLDAFFSFSVGSYVLDQGEWMQSYMDGTNNTRANMEEDVNMYYSGQIPTGPNSSETYVDPFSQVITSRFIRNADYLRLRHIRFSYDLPLKTVKKAYLSKAQVYVAAQNLLTITGYEGWDPEAANQAETIPANSAGYGAIGFHVPQMRIYSMGFKLNF